MTLKIKPIHPITILLVTIILSICWHKFAYASDQSYDKNGYTAESAAEYLGWDNIAKNKKDAVLGYSPTLDEYFIYYSHTTNALRFEPEKNRIFVDNYFGGCITTGGTETKKDITVTDLGNIYRISGDLTLIEHGKIAKAYTQKDIDMRYLDLNRLIRQAKIYKALDQIIKILPVLLATIVALLGIRKSIAYIYNTIRNA